MVKADQELERYRTESGRNGLFSRIAGFDRLTVDHIWIASALQTISIAVLSLVASLLFGRRSVGGNLLVAFLVSGTFMVGMTFAHSRRQARPMARIHRQG